MTDAEQGPVDTFIEARLRALLRSLGQSVAHDLGGPAQKAAAFAEMLREDLGSELGRDAEESLHCLETSVAQLTAGLARLALWCRLPEEPAGFVDEPLGDLLSRASGLRSGLVWSCQESAAPIACDPGLLALLLAELLHNAASYAPGEVPLVEWDPGHGVLTIRDRGPGLTEDQRSLATIPFRRFVGATEAPGAGLGLAIAQRIAQMHGAALTLSDGAPGLVAEIRFERRG